MTKYHSYSLKTAAELTAKALTAGAAVAGCSAEATNYKVGGETYSTAEAAAEALVAEATKNSAPSHGHYHLAA